MTEMADIDALIDEVSRADGADRFGLWTGLLRQVRARSMLELGVWRGEFAARVLSECSMIKRYYMIDPWRHLSEWNKPANVEQGRFDEIFSEAMAATAFAADRRIVLKGTTVEMIDDIPDASLDVAYVDADHTLKGISIDLILAYRKVRPGGILAGDDYTPSIWQHSDIYEPSLVCPFAAYFAESQQATLVVLPFNQFAIIKPIQSTRKFRVIETVPGYGKRSLLWQIEKKK